MIDQGYLTKVVTLIERFHNLITAVMITYLDPATTSVDEKE